MTSTILHPTPPPGQVLRAQIRAVGSALRWPAVVALALGTLATVLVTTQLRVGGPLAFHPEHQMLPGMLGLLLPLAVWRGETRFGAGFLWTLPVDRRRHALAKVFAGWVWLTAAVALFVAWLLALTLLSGASVLAEETILVLRSSTTPLRGLLDPAAVETVRWTPRPLLWLVPFTAATGAYLLTSALVLGVRHPLRWIAGAVLGLLLVDAVGTAVGAEWLDDAPELLMRWLLDGPYGFDVLLTARTESLKTLATLSTGEEVVVWRALPQVGRWATATLLWTGAGLLALWAAASRHRGHRRR
ncbi:MAG TPA: hypothetical protein VHQ65_16240 [Thermoanaerobaculia bacterium]|nr:hypothetical protein [Thermoanaerobaculia bacterium]